jgi:hypothetical protein
MIREPRWMDEVRDDVGMITSEFRMLPADQDDDARVNRVSSRESSLLIIACSLSSPCLLQGLRRLLTQFTVTGFERIVNKQPAPRPFIQLPSRQPLGLLPFLQAQPSLGSLLPLDPRLSLDDRLSPRSSQPLQPNQPLQSACPDVHIVSRMARHSQIRLACVPGTRNT